MNVTPPPKNCVNFKSRQLARLLSRHYDAALSAAGLKTTQFSLLSHVLRFGPIAPGELAQRMGLDASTLTRNVRPMLVAGWLHQGAGTDARNRSITITPTGRRIQAKGDQYWLEAQESIKALLGQERVAALLGMIEECLVLLRENGDSQDS